jgi:UDP-N-acetylglucosamine 2-epimerase
MLFLTANSKMVITDSGGLQKEAFLLKIPCTTLRSETEWVETLVNGWNVLSNISENDILEKIHRKDIGDYPPVNPFGHGVTAKKIVELIEKENYK